MQIFQQEYDDGLSESIMGKKSLSFASVVEPLSIDAVSKQMKALASIKDTDMQYVQSILVTSNWNKNDDIFEPEEIWKAKETPEHKPTNLNHDEKLIIDLKTTNDIQKFKSSAYRYNYDSQAYIYKNIFDYDFLFIAIDKNTHQIGIFDCSDRFYESGADKVKKATEVYDLFYKTDGFDPNQYFITKTL